MHSLLRCVLSRTLPGIRLSVARPTARSASVVTSQPYSQRDAPPVRPKMEVKMFDILLDNYMYLLVDTETREAAAVDVVTQPERILEEVKKLDVNLSALLTTHYYPVHPEGARELMEMVPSMKVYSGHDRLPWKTTLLKHDDEFKIGRLNVKVIGTPCHTRGHVCFYITAPTGEPPIAFTGDTLLVGGCGVFLEGTPDEMYRALYDKIAKLPDETIVYCTHDYGLMHLKFAAEVEPDNKAISDKLAWVEKKLANKEPAMPSTIAEEKATNPFLRVLEPSVIKYTGLKDPIDALALLRQKSDVVYWSKPH